MRSIKHRILGLTIAGALGGFAATAGIAASPPDFKGADSNGEAW